MKTFPMVTTDQFATEAQRWFKTFARGENVSVLFFPKTDRLRRLQQIIDDPTFSEKTLGKSPRMIFLVFEIGFHNVEDIEDLQVHFAGKLNMSGLSRQPRSFDDWIKYIKENQLQIVIVLPQAERYLTEEGKSILSLLQYLLNQHAPYFLLLSMFEVDVMNPSFVSSLTLFTQLFQNVYYYPLYSEEDAVAFLHYLQRKWNVNLTKSEEKNILAACGGHFWLLKEMVRQKSEQVKEIESEEGLRFRIQSIYGSLLPVEQRVLFKIFTKQKKFSSDEERSLKYLKIMNFLDQDGRCKVGLFKNYVLEKDQGSIRLNLSEGKVFLNQISVQRFFSKQEYRVLKRLLEKAGHIISRDEIATCMWPSNTQNQYSDWAIDQLIARLRRRFGELSLSPGLLQVVRGKGYLLTLQQRE